MYFSPSCFPWDDHPNLPHSGFLTNRLGLTDTGLILVYINAYDREEWEWTKSMRRVHTQNISKVHTICAVRPSRRPAEHSVHLRYQIAKMFKDVSVDSQDQRSLSRL